jgi:hypothetical protein
MVMQSIEIVCHGIYHQVLRLILEYTYMYTILVVPSSFKTGKLKIENGVDSNPPGSRGHWPRSKVG